MLTLVAAVGCAERGLPTSLVKTKSGRPSPSRSPMDAPSSHSGLVHHNADGTFAPATLLPSYDRASNVAFAGDGLAPEERYTVPYVNYRPRLIAVGDVNSAGRPDVVLVTPLQLAVLYRQ